jgi:hypothetical protein
MSFNTVIVDQRNHVGFITLNRPEQFNTFSSEIKKALNLEKKKNDLIEGEKMHLLEAEVNDIQKEFDRARDVFLKKVHQFIQVRNEVDELWLKLKDTVNKAG